MRYEKVPKFETPLQKTTRTA